MARKPAQPGVDRRQQILEAALEVFAEQGFDGATTKDIAKRADVTHGLIYFYFDSKEELFLAAFEQEAQAIFGSLDFAGLLESDALPEVELTAMLTRFLRALASAPAQNMMRVMMHMAAHGERDKGPLRECKGFMEGQVQMLVTQMREYLDRQVAKGRLRSLDTKLVATLLLGSAMVLFRSGRYGLGQEQNCADSIDALAATLADTFLHGLLAPSGSVPSVAPDTPLGVHSATSVPHKEATPPTENIPSRRATRPPHKTADAVLSVSEG
jgi:AcrR family transcriptional regulator